MANTFHASGATGALDASAGTAFPPFPPCPRGPAGPPGPLGPRGLPGSLNSTAACFVYAQLAHLLEQLIELYPGMTLYVFLPGISPWWVSGIPERVYQSTEGTYAGLFILDGSGEVAFPLSAIAALQFETGTAVYNPAITYLPKPTFPPGCDTNIVTAIYEYVSTLTGEVLINIGSNVRSTGPIYLNRYGMIVQADELGNDPAFVPLTYITGIAPQEMASEAETAAAEAAPSTRIQASLLP
ncbi:MAG TPA: hypothetical protein PKY19_02300 [Oscillospiraceae bacterium]|nr:hypothetical protein [Oscillospiraceae bacterium]HXK77299.1 hypothetical protein [Oscillospiraceae bacterium]